MKYTFLVILCFCAVTVNAQLPLAVAALPQDTSVLMSQPVRQHAIRLAPMIVPAVAMTYGVMALHNRALHQLDKSTSGEISEDDRRFRTSMDNYLQYAPALAVYGLNVAGVKGKSNFKNRTIKYLLATAITGVVATTLKNTTKVMRPDGSSPNSFPSGHTTTAFAAAEFLNQEYKDVSPFISAAGYTAAAATGVLRMMNRRHYLSDVIFGAGLGMATTKLVYAVYPVIERKVSGKKNAKHQAFQVP